MALDETHFPLGVAEQIINTFEVNEDNHTNIIELLIFARDLSELECQDLINEIRSQLAV